MWVQCGEYNRLAQYCYVSIHEILATLSVWCGKFWRSDIRAVKGIMLLAKATSGCAFRQNAIMCSLQSSLLWWAKHLPGVVSLLHAKCFEKGTYQSTSFVQNMSSCRKTSKHRKCSCEWREKQVAPGVRRSWGTRCVREIQERRNTSNYLNLHLCTRRFPGRYIKNILWQWIVAWRCEHASLSTSLLPNMIIYRT